MTIKKISFIPLYRLDALVAEKAASAKLHPRSIIEEAAAFIGVHKYRFARIMRLDCYHPGALNVRQLKALAYYFNCGIDDLLVDDYTPAASEDRKSVV